MEAQEKVLYYLSADGKAEFDPNGKSGEVTMMVKSQTSETLQVSNFQILIYVDEWVQIVMGYRSFGVDEIDMQQLLDVLMDPEARKDFDKQTADGE